MVSSSKKRKKRISRSNSLSSKQEDRILKYLYRKAVHKDNSQRYIEYSEIVEYARQFETKPEYKQKKYKSYRDDIFRNTVCSRYMTNLKENKLVLSESKGIYSLTRNGFKVAKQRILDTITLRNMDENALLVDVKTKKIDEDSWKITLISKHKQLNQFITQTKQNNYEFFNLLEKSFNILSRIEAANMLERQENPQKPRPSLVVDPKEREELIIETETSLSDFYRFQAENMILLADNMDNFDVKNKNILQSSFLNGEDSTEFLMENMLKDFHKVLYLHTDLSKHYLKLIDELTPLVENSPNSEHILSLLVRMQTKQLKLQTDTTQLMKKYPLYSVTLNKLVKEKFG